MRVHGASKWQLVKLVLQEGMTLSLLGAIFGVLISRLTLFFMTFLVEQKYALSSFQFNLINEELWLFPIALFIGLAASLIPTIQTYNINIPKTLSNASITNYTIFVISNINYISTRSQLRCYFCNMTTTPVI